MSASSSAPNYTPGKAAIEVGKNGLFPQSLSRRGFMGFSGLALCDLLSRQESRAATPTSPASGDLEPHFPARAKRMIFIMLDGGISQVDSYDYKPRLQAEHGQPLPASIKSPKFTFAERGHIIGSPFEWSQWGETGSWASDLFPKVNRGWLDKLCFIHSLHHENEDHITAMSMLNTGVPRELRPSMGNWLLYGLGSDNSNLPGYVDLTPKDGKAFPTGFLPSSFAGAPILKPSRRGGELMWDNLAAGFSDQRAHLDFIQAINEESDPLIAELRNRELAFRMQNVAPEIMDLNKESKATKELYGVGADHTDEFGRTLLLARRFAEAGVRFVTATHSTSRYGNLWDQHAGLEKGHRGNANAVDQPIAALLHDLESRGMLEDTLVLCGSEFGRTPSREIFDGQMGRSDDGRDHNPHGFTMWMCGGGTKQGYHHGATDDYGYYAIRDKVSIHDLHATILHLLGIDHKRLTFHHSGRDYRLTDVFGKVVNEIIG